MIESGEKHNSVFRVISIGVVAENKLLDTDLVQVHPVEMLNIMDGELAGSVVEDAMNGLNEDGTMYEAKIHIGATIECEWLQDESQRITSPDVRRGEQVLIWQSGQSDKYYWSSMGRDEKLRRLETVIYRIDGNPENADAEIDMDNSYSLEVSSHKRMITLRTSDLNDEFTRYTFQFDTGKGLVTLEDDLGNVIQLNSKTTTILLHNADNSQVELSKKNIYIHSLGQIQLLTRDIALRCKDLLVDVTNNLKINTTGWFCLNSKADITLCSNDKIKIRADKNIEVVSKQQLILQGSSNKLVL